MAVGGLDAAGGGGAARCGGADGRGGGGGGGGSGGGGRRAIRGGGGGGASGLSAGATAGGAAFSSPDERSRPWCCNPVVRRSRASRESISRKLVGAGSRTSSALIGLSPCSAACSCVCSHAAQRRAAQRSPICCSTLFSEGGPAVEQQIGLRCANRSEFGVAAGASRRSAATIWTARSRSKPSAAGSRLHNLFPHLLHAIIS